MSKILITGGAGFLGINLVRYLLARDHQVLSYDFADFDYPEKNEITVITKDIRNKADLDTIMNNVDFMVHCAAALPLYSEADIYTTDVEGTRNVLTSAFEHGVQRVIHISSTAVYGIPDHHPLFENDELVGVGPYGEAKILAEQECAKFRKQGKCVPIIRPKSFVGPERLGIFALFYDWALSGHNFPMIGMGNNRYQLLDVEDLCDAIYLCITKDESIANNTFNIGAKEYTTMKEDYQAVLNKAGYGKKIIGFPAAPMIWTLRILEALKISPLYKWVYETASVDSFVSIKKAEEQLGYTPKYSNKQALVRNYDWYVSHLDSFKNASGVSHRVPWKQGVLGIVKHLF